MMPPDHRSVRPRPNGRVQAKARSWTPWRSRNSSRGITTNPTGEWVTQQARNSASVRLNAKYTNGRTTMLSDDTRQGLGTMARRDTDKVPGQHP